MVEPKLYTAEDLAGLMQVTTEFVRNRARQGVWPSQRLGPRTIRFTTDQYREILALTECRPTTPVRAARQRNARIAELLKGKAIG